LMEARTIRRQPTQAAHAHSHRLARRPSDPGTTARCRRDRPIPARPTPVGVTEISRGLSAANTPGPRPTHIASTLQGCQKARVNTINAGKKRPPGSPPHTAPNGSA
jgi:hypothetical protein